MSVWIVILSVGLGSYLFRLSMILLTIPIFFPVVMGLQFGLSPEHTAIWFGILALIVVELGLIHPPVGLNLYVASMIARMRITELAVAVWPWLVTMLFFLVIVTYWPELTLFVPRLLGML